MIHLLICNGYKHGSFPQTKILSLKRNHRDKNLSRFCFIKDLEFVGVINIVVVLILLLEKYVLLSVSENILLLHHLVNLNQPH